MNKFRSAILAVLAALISIGTPMTAYADSFQVPPEITNREKAHLNIAFTGGGNDGKCDESGTTLSGANNKEKVWNFFVNKGLSAEQTAGIMGNMAVESGFDPTVVQGGSHSTNPASISAGWGIIQWTPGSKIIGLLERADISGNPSELATQLELVLWHMNYTSPTGVTNMYAQYQNVTDVAEATRMFEDLMEGAGIPHIERRIEEARTILAELGGGGDAAGADTDLGGCTDEGGIASANGFTFPLRTTKAVILAGSSLGGANLKWCHTSQTNCHHDYKAADIMVVTGTTVVAAKAGTVQKSSRSGSPGNVTINSSDGKGINFYQHLDAGSVTVSAGQKVSAGQVLGKVGDSTDAFGTAPHLHFDMLPSQYKYRVSCAGASCSGYPFIEVQPALTETFKLLN